MNMKKAAGLLIVAALVFSVCITGSFAAENVAVEANGNIILSNSSSISGNVIMNGGTMSGQEWANPVNGIVYTASGAVVQNQKITSMNFEGTAGQEVFPVFASFPESDVFAGCTFADGSKSFTVGWWGSDGGNGYTLTENAYFSSLTINSDLEMNLAPAAGTVLILRVGTLNLYGNLNITGEGSVVIYADHIDKGRNNTVNASGDPAKLMILLRGENTELTNFKQVRANIAVPEGNITVKNVKMEGNLYAAGNVSIRNSSQLSGLVLAPASTTQIGESAGITGRLITASLSMTGNSFINYGPAGGVSDEIWNEVTENTAGEGPQEPEPDVPDADKIQISVVIPKKMSVRLEDGTILKSGDTFEAAIGQTIRFQMCSNNWENDLYDDTGNGLAGTVVYHFRVADSYTERGYDPENHTLTAPKGDPVLRTDTNNFFMAYRYHFTKGDYNKQTGISHVVNTPIESLSVNLPLGSTIVSSAYKSFEHLATENVFIEQAADKTISYQDYYWDY